jgi:hypothetical protein
MQERDSKPEKRNKSSRSHVDDSFSKFRATDFAGEKEKVFEGGCNRLRI